ncbi:sigma-70 family RNA polymerase sigma factor [Demequina sp. B12]|uniref:sigma-70 family RNA polymerase sigma factor n=1 Tax=Demequina sp. B12 TaxID=2992757 RepID=UPI00237B437D|nr:sigma-70 family RNA polymerase sigma factor [Demequina sp. B12]MDE0571826.1 sigma-70 family RNA polymerase sigma factor [Demequina sp. B12]
MSRGIDADPHRASADLVAEVLRVAGVRLASYGWTLTGSEHAGEELVQAALVKTFVRRRRLTDVGAAEGYVRATMRTMHIDGLRRDTTWGRLKTRVVGNPVMADATAEIEARDEVSRALATLAPRVRTAVALRYYDDLTVDDVAAAMKLSPGTVKKYLADGRAALAPLLGVPIDEPESIPVKGGQAR